MTVPFTDKQMETLKGVPLPQVRARTGGAGSSPGLSRLFVVSELVAESLSSTFQLPPWKELTYFLEAGVLAQGTLPPSADTEEKMQTL